MKTFYVALLLVAGCTSILSQPPVDEAQGDGKFTTPLEPGGVFFSTFNNDNTFERYSVIEIVPRTQAHITALRNLEGRRDLTVNFWQDPTRPGNAVHMMLSPKDLAEVSKLFVKVGLRYKVIHSKIGESMKKENIRHGSTVFSTFSGFDYGRYHPLQEIHSEMQSLASRFSNLVKVFQLGTSYESRPMHAIQISSSQGGNSNKKTFFFNCGIHAREWVTPATCMYMINQMLTKYGKDTAITAMVDKMDWIVLPVFNVDGYEYTWSGSRARFWRKTRKPSGRGCVGTDPNRNWNVNWGGVGTSRNPCADTYRGQRPFSETEVLQVARFLYSIRKKLVGYVDIHAYSQLWMTPWGHTTTRPRDFSEMNRVASIAVSALRKPYGTYYKYGPSSVVIYRTTGGSNDWVYDKLGVTYSYAIELRDKGRFGFLLPSNQIIPTAFETFQAFKAMANSMRI